MLYLIRIFALSASLLIVNALTVKPVQAQNNTAALSGYIKDANTGETLIAANIALLEINRGTTTNTLGTIPLPIYSLAPIL